MSKKRIDRELIRQAIIEEAAYWDTTDTSAEMAQETDWLTFEWVPREDRCDRCGAKMQRRKVNLQLSGGRVVLRRVTRYVCLTPGCGQTRLVPAAATLAEEIEALVRRTSIGVIAPISSPRVQAAQVREDGVEYMADKPDQR